MDGYLIDGVLQNLLLFFLCYWALGASRSLLSALGEDRARRCGGGAPSECGGLGPARSDG